MHCCKNIVCICIAWDCLHKLLVIFLVISVNFLLIQIIPQAHTGKITGLGIRSFDFRANPPFFVQKWVYERFAQKNERFTQSLIFGEQPEQFAHDRSFPLSYLSKSLMVAHFWWVTWGIRSHRSFHLSKMSDSLTLLTKKEEMSKNEQFASFLP